MSILGNLNQGRGPGYTVWDEVFANPPQYNQGSLQNLAGQAGQNLTAQNVADMEAAIKALLEPDPAPVRRATPLVRVDIAAVKLHAQVHELVRALPMSIAGSIRTCVYYERDPVEAARFVITFSNRRELVFYDVDKFPSAEHIGRIALECP